MTDVDAVRLLASEYNLEFVDLDRYNVDPTAASVLAPGFARQHGVLPVGRRFGAPVIAISDPADVVTMDTLRVVIGREFISVVASPQQIQAYLERVYGESPDGSAPAGGGNGAAPPATTAPEPATEASSPGDDPIAAALDDAIGGAMKLTEGGADAHNGVVLYPPAGDGHVDALSVPEVTGGSAVVPPAHSGTTADVERTADMVEEAVAEFEQSSDLLDTPHDDLPPLARVLVEGERVSAEDMQAAIEEHNRTSQTLARVLTARGLVTEGDLMWGMAKEMGLEFVDLDIRGFNFSVSTLLPEATARHHNVVVIDNVDGVPVVAASNPTDVFAMDDLRTIMGRKFVTVVATRSQIASYIERVYHQGGDAEEVAQTAAMDLGEEAAEEVEGLAVVVDDAPIVRYVNLLILQALNERASDIHVEPTAENLRIRYRIDGVLHDTSTAPKGISAAVCTRLKVMAEMNIAEHRVPQDGRISLQLGTRHVDLRVATLPTIYGEKIVMRVLDKSNVVLSFEELGFDTDLYERYATAYNKPYGTILVTGPTGSGKTTTLYATLSALNSPEKNIITVEDPVELRIKGVNQVQLNLKAGLTYASALRSILRSDPDIVLVGEVRDRETALISVEAALTGHLVLSTLHTNSAAGTPMRLVEMGLEAYLVTSGVSAALAQRLCRRLCPNCKEPYEPTEADIHAAGWSPDEVVGDDGPPTLYKAGGCAGCSNTGYRGRKALLELLIVTEEIERMIIEGGSADDLQRLAIEQGMVPLRKAGLRRALSGETTLEEVLRVVA